MSENEAEGRGVRRMPPSSHEKAVEPRFIGFRLGVLIRFTQRCPSKDVPDQKNFALLINKGGQPLVPHHNMKKFQQNTSASFFGGRR
jgi:hypothetical protein